jgi:uncharacterized protein YcgI (DUF1989 family)
MFKSHWWSGKTVSDEGFSITLRGRTQLLYKIGGKTMIVTVEGAGRYIDVFHSSMRSWENDSSLIDGKTDELNVDNITRALESRGLNVRIVT